MLKQRWCRIINLTSIFGQMGPAGHANYAASKRVLICLQMAWRGKSARAIFLVNAVAPDSRTSMNGRC